MKERIKTHKKLLGLHGASVTCKIKGKFIKDGKICVEYNSVDVGKDRVFICQDENNGSNAKDKLGYQSSWVVSDSDVGLYEEDDRHCTEIKIVIKD